MVETSNPAALEQKRFTSYNDCEVLGRGVPIKTGKRKRAQRKGGEKQDRKYAESN